MHKANPHAMGPVFLRFLGAPRGARIGPIAWGLAFGKEFRECAKICDVYQAAAIPCGLTLLTAVWRAQKKQSRGQGDARQENAHDLTTSAPAAIFGNAATLLGQTSAMLSVYPKSPLSGLCICLQSSTATQIRSVYTNPASQISTSIGGGGIFPFKKRRSWAKCLSWIAYGLQKCLGLEDSCICHACLT